MKVTPYVAYIFIFYYSRRKTAPFLPFSYRHILFRQDFSLDKISKILFPSFLFCTSFQNEFYCTPSYIFPSFLFCTSFQNEFYCTPSYRSIQIQALPQVRVVRHVEPSRWVFKTQLPSHMIDLSCHEPLIEPCEFFNCDLMLLLVFDSCGLSTWAVVYLFIYLGFYVAFNTVQVISRQVVGRAEETSTHSSLGFCTVNCRPTASNYQLSHLRPWRGSNPGLRGGRRECYHSATVAPHMGCCLP